MSEGESIHTLKSSDSIWQEHLWDLVELFSKEEIVVNKHNIGKCSSADSDRLDIAFFVELSEEVRDEISEIIPGSSWVESESEKS